MPHTVRGEEWHARCLRSKESVSRASCCHSYLTVWLLGRGGVSEIVTNEISTTIIEMNQNKYKKMIKRDNFKRKSERI